jgi:hypothetical protein
MKPLRTTTLAGLVLVFTSCTSTFQIWRDPNYKATPVHRVFVSVDYVDVEARARAEDAIARLIKLKGFEVATSSSVFPPGQAFPEKVLAYAKEADVDLLLVQHLSRTNCDSTADAGCIKADTSAYAVKVNAEVPVWTGTSRGAQYLDFEGVAESVESSLVDELTKAQILVR